MNCPTCGEKMKPLDKVCRACHFMPETGHVIALEPRRQSRVRKWWNGRGPSGRIGMFKTRRLTENKAKPGRSLVIGMVAGFVPGLGHLYFGKIVLGVFFMAGVGGLLAATHVVYGNDLVRVSLGFACALHAISLLDLVSGYLKNSIANRIAVMGGLTLILGTVIYWPLMRYLAPLQPVMIQGGHGSAIGYQTFDGILAILYTVIGFVAISFIAHHIAKVIPRKNPPGNADILKGGMTR